MTIDLRTLPIHIVQGEGCSRQLGELAVQIGGKRALVVTDHGIEEAGHVDKARESLKAAGLHVGVFNEVHENPTTEDVEACAACAREHGADMLIGLGGGSSMDAAKGTNFILTNGGRIQDYWGIDKATKPMLPFIAVPTTAGTGSECQRFALISDPVTHQKMACGDPKAAAKVTLLDPLLTMTQPPFVTACTGIDALAHAVETAVTKASTPTSLQYSHEAFLLLDAHFDRVLSHPDDLKARSAMQIGAALAGTAIEHSMLGAVHSAANPLTARFNIVHGQAIAIMLPEIVAYNGQDEETAQKYKALLLHADRIDEQASSTEAVNGLVKQLNTHAVNAGLQKPLSQWGIAKGHLQELSCEATQQWTAQFNPREVAAEDFVRWYEKNL